jgi:hypothetical protein
MNNHIRNLAGPFAASLVATALIAQCETQYDADLMFIGYPIIVFIAYMSGKMARD